MTAGRALGDFGERLAVARLEQSGYRVLERNVAVRPWGEIDIVAERDGVLALVEVRTRRGGRFGGAALSLSPRKLQRMRNAALAYLTERRYEGPIRLDVFLIDLDAQGRVIAMRHIENAVEDG